MPWQALPGALAAALLLVLAVTGGPAPRLKMEPCPSPGAGEPPCGFRITEAEARRVAAAAGLGPGLKPWDTSFHYFYGRLGDKGPDYVWSVSNTTEEGGEGQGYQAGGATVLLDARTGRVLERSGWFLVS